jgi:D-sedoheptulose 7-phosphate isomerase
MEGLGTNGSAVAVGDQLRWLTWMVEQLDVAPVDRTIDLLFDAYQRRAIVTAIGNGGSASTAAHFLADLSKFATHPAPGFRALDVISNLSSQTAWTNDEGWDHLHRNLLQQWIGPGDVVVGFSVHGGSGWSGNLVEAMRFARERGAHTVGVAGDGGGLFRTVCDVCIEIPTPPAAFVTPLTEAMHVVVHHVICTRLLALVSAASTAAVSTPTAATEDRRP